MHITSRPRSRGPDSFRTGRVRYTHFQALTLSLRSLIQKLQVPVVVLGIGTQVMGFMETALPQGSEDSAPVQKYRGNARLRMAWNQHSAVEDLVLDGDQVDLLNAVKNHSRNNVANIAVRGDVSEQVCRNSGVSNCQSLGCSSLMLSRNTALGVRVVLHSDQVGGLAQAGLRKSQ